MKSDDLPTVSVVIPTRRRPELVERSLTELRRDPAMSEVVVVVGGDEIGEAALTRWRRLDNRVQTIRAATDRDDVMERGELPRDQGVVASSAEVILALDDDVIPRPGLVTGHAAAHAVASGLCVVGYMPVSSRNADKLTGTARVYSEGYERACDRFAANQETILLGLWGGNYSLRRVDWLASMQLPRIPAGYQGDREFGLRLRSLGLRPVFDRALRAEHWYQREIGQLVEDAESAGLGHARLLASYPELEVNPAAPAPHPRRAIAVLQDAMRSDVAWRVASSALRSCASAAANTGLEAVERVSIRTLWQLAFHRGTLLDGTRSAGPA